MSHPELIRAGEDQRLEIENFDFRMNFQHPDADTLAPVALYDDLPWEISLSRSVSE